MVCLLIKVLRQNRRAAIELKDSEKEDWLLLLGVKCLIQDQGNGCNGQDMWQWERAYSTVVNIINQESQRHRTVCHITE